MKTRLGIRWIFDLMIFLTLRKFQFLFGTLGIFLGGFCYICFILGKTFIFFSYRSLISYSSSMLRRKIGIEIRKEGFSFVKDFLRMLWMNIWGCNRSYSTTLIIVFNAVDSIISMSECWGKKEAGMKHCSLLVVASSFFPCWH